MDYSTKEVKNLNDLEAIRLRPGMYIGATTNPAHLFQEAFDNALDEIMMGHATVLTVEVDTIKDTYTVSDDGRGIPLGVMNLEIMGQIFKKESLEVLTSKGHSGGKYGQGGYKISSGLNGIGLKCMSALSEQLNVTVVRKHDDTKKWTQGFISYSKGKIQEHKYKTVPKTIKSGTTVTLKADSTIFDSIQIPLSYIKNKCMISKAFGYNVKLVVDSKNIDLPKGGLDTLLEHGENKPIVKPIIIKCDDENTGESLAICVQYNSNIDCKTKGFTNMLYNAQGGTHVRWLERYIVDAWKEVIGNKKLSVELKDTDYLIGCRSVIALFIQHTSFSSQTKERLVTKINEFKDLLDKFKTNFIKYLSKNIEVQELLIKKFIAYRTAQNALLASKTVQGLVEVAEIKDGKVRRKAPVEELSECSSKDVSQTEIFLCEGNSAEGGLKTARDPRYHATLPLKGKIRNVSGLKLDDALKNTDVLKIVNSIGCGVADNSDAKKSRYGKVIIACFLGNMKVPMVDGTIKSFEELVKLKEQGQKEFLVYSLDSKGKIVEGKAENPRVVKMVTELVDLDFGDGVEITCTPDHKFRLTDGSYKRADELEPTDDVSEIDIRNLKEKYNELKK